MNLLALAELIAAYVFVGALVCVLLLAVVINWRGLPPLLDGTPLGSALDDRDRRRCIDEADARLTLLVELEQTWALPAREPRA